MVVDEFLEGVAPALGCAADRPGTAGGGHRRASELGLGRTFLLLLLLSLLVLELCGVVLDGLAHLAVHDELGESAAYCLAGLRFETCEGRRCEAEKSLSRVYEWVSC